MKVMIWLFFMQEKPPLTDCNLPSCQFTCLVPGPVIQEEEAAETITEAMRPDPSSQEHALLVHSISQSSSFSYCFRFL